jgi:succinate-semialdehyde dehydrogenase / glutarate-semialdehyde dehydrogenase
MPGTLPGYPDVPSDLWIGGEWRAARDGARLDVVDPSTGESFAAVAAGSPADAVAAVDAAADAAPSWAHRAPRERGEVLRSAFELLTAEVDRLAELIVRENGKSLADARGEVVYAAEFLRWFAEEAVRVDGGLVRSPSGQHRIISLHEPIGVSLLVTPWNFPAAMGARKIAPALAAGCTVLIKPASETPLTMLAIADLLARAGAPDGTVNVVPAQSSSKVVAAALDDRRVRKLSFTGSTEVGKVLLAKAAERVVDCSMELGGNAPFIVFADADIDAAVEGAVLAKMRNGGASCIAANRFVVAEQIAEPFAAGLAHAMGALQLGPGLDPTTDVGPLVSAAERQHVADLVDSTVDAGARVRVGAEIPDRPGWFYPPTVLDDIPSDAGILAEEVFGPVAPLTTFVDEQDAITHANDTPHGLAAYVYTGDLARGLRFCEALDTGMIGLNRGFISDPAAPFGGVKESGIGREGGHEGLLEFCETKYIAVDW